MSKAFKCDVCNGLFANARNQEIHIRKKGDWLDICDLCYLKIAQMIDTDEYCRVYDEIKERGRIG